MKILSVELENLNSLVGRWKIDFTDSVFAASGIFAIVGPTGAGKTTILDAICLALFGCTPRLGKITTSDNEIMSRHTNKCSAEVVFETNQQGKFRCSWSQHRAGKKATGNLQPVKHEIADADTGEIIETKISLVPAIVEEKTGMNFDRFTRSMLLAQGEFAKFLQSDDTKRGEILEQITGTEIYADISITVFERNKTERAKLEVLETQLGETTLLDAAELEKHRRELDELTEREKDAAVEREAVNVVIERYQKLDRLAEQKKNLDERRKQLEQSEAAFQAEGKRLAKAIQAATLEPAFERLDTLRKQLDTNLAETAKTNAEIPLVEKNVEKEIEREKTANDSVAAIQTERETRSPLLRQVRELDTKIGEVDKQLKEQGIRFADAEKKWEKQQKVVDRWEKHSISLLPTFQGTFEQRVQAAGEACSVFEAELKNLLQDRQISQIIDERTAQERKRENHRELDNVQQSIAAMLEKATRLADGLGILETKIKETTVNRESLQKVKEETDREIERLEEKSRLLERIRSLEDERKHLVDGNPCPLCGAMEHPYAGGNVPEPDETTRLLAATKKEQKKTGEAIGKLDVQLAKLQKDVEQHDKDKRTNLAETEKSQQQLADVLRQLGHETLPDDVVCRTETEALENRIAVLTQTISTAEDLRKRMRESERELKAAEKHQGDLKIERTLFQSLDEQLERLKTERETITRSRNELIDERHKIFGNGNPDEEERLRADEENKALARHKETQTVRRKAEQNLTSLLSRMRTLNQTLQNCRNGIEAESRRFAVQCSEKFDTEQEFLDARLPSTDREKLEKQQKELERRRHELDTLTGECDDVSQKVRESIPPEGDPPRQTVAARKTELDNELKKFSENRGRLQERIGNDKQLQERRNEILARRDRQVKESRRWQMLNDLIGSHDGKKFRTFAQGLTFRTMIDHANKQLLTMSDRYCLVPGETRPLELAVVDAYQANVVRSTTNLSGGESFLVSLALALGLSSMSSRSVRIDSLFLDEGFGTLDDQTLDTALSALESLRQDGKQIGIISHVAAIKERIAAQILVKKKSGARSIIVLPILEPQS